MACKKQKVCLHIVLSHLLKPSIGSWAWSLFSFPLIALFWYISTDQFWLKELCLLSQYNFRPFKSRPLSTMSRQCFVQFKIRLTYSRLQCFFVAIPQTPPDTSLSLFAQERGFLQGSTERIFIKLGVSLFLVSSLSVIFFSFLAADPISTESKSEKRYVKKDVQRNFSFRSHWNWPRIELLIDRLMYDDVFVSSYGTHFLPFPQNHLANSLTLTLPKTNWMN